MPKLPGREPSKAPLLDPAECLVSYFAMVLDSRSHRCSICGVVKGGLESGWQNSAVLVDANDEYERRVGVAYDECINLIGGPGVMWSDDEVAQYQAKVQALREERDQMPG